MSFGGHGFYKYAAPTEFAAPRGHRFCSTVPMTGLDCRSKPCAPWLMRMRTKRAKTLCVLVVGREMKLDQQPNNPINTIPIKCKHCRLADVDFVPKPYLLGKSTSIPLEMAFALRGNFLVRERVKRILEVAAPGACRFHRTIEAKSRRPAPWWLAVPVRTLKAFYPEPSVPCCSKCRNPPYWDHHYPRVMRKMRKFDSGGVDVFKSLAWKASRFEGVEPPSWFGYDRELFFSVRLEELLKRAKVKGLLVASPLFADVHIGPADVAWIERNLVLLAEHGLIDAPNAGAGKPSSAARRWFAQFLKSNARKGVKPIKLPNFSALEQKHKLTLPQDYKTFVSTIGSKTFKDVNDMEGAETSVLLPQKLDFRSYRRGKAPWEEDEHANLDGVIFATIDNGDCFVFDVSGSGSDYPVYWYQHEENALDPYAPNFVECIRRFAQRI
jgi:hypothetical protein